MKLQKLVYIAQGFHLALFSNGDPLIYSNVHAWEFGPVFPKLYNKLRKFGSGTITQSLPVDGAEELDSVGENVISGVWSAYKDKSAGTLSTLTHMEGTPWSVTWDKERFGVIPNDLIAIHYKEKITDPGNGSC